MFFEQGRCENWQKEIVQNMASIKISDLSSAISTVESFLNVARVADSVQFTQQINKIHIRDVFILMNFDFKTNFLNIQL